MIKQSSRSYPIVAYPLTPKRWNDFVNLLGPTGCSGCWCMWPRIDRSVFIMQKGNVNKVAMKSIVDTNDIPGLIAYYKEKPVAWCAIAPREKYTIIPKMDNDANVWSIVCFFVARHYRLKGITSQLIQAAKKYAMKNGAMIIESYPITSHQQKVSSDYSWHGFVSTFEKEGFVVMTKISEKSSMMRYRC